MVALEVPVLPAAGQARWCAAPGQWPLVTTRRSSCEVSQAVRGGMAGLGCLPASGHQAIQPQLGGPIGSRRRGVVLEHRAAAVAHPAHVDRIDQHAVARERRERAGQLVHAARRRRPAPAPGRG